LILYAEIYIVLVTASIALNHGAQRNINASHVSCTHGRGFVYVHNKCSTIASITTVPDNFLLAGHILLFCYATTLILRTLTESNRKQRATNRIRPKRFLGWWILQFASRGRQSWGRRPGHQLLRSCISQLSYDSQLYCMDFLNVLL
jgi:hypothetical protein